METRSRIVVADDHPIFRKGLVEVLRAEPQFSLVGEAWDGTQASEMIHRLKPQVALLDIDMPGTQSMRKVTQ